jgi:CDP-paratose 2-epimerase
MASRKVLITGSSGLIGSEAVAHFDGQGYEVHGIDNNVRRFFFGDPGDTSWNPERLRITTKNFSHHDIDMTALPSKRFSVHSASISSFIVRLSPLSA